MMHAIDFRVRDEVLEDQLHDVAGLRARFQVLACGRATPAERADIARLGAKLAELRHLVLSTPGSARDRAAVPLLAAWISCRLDVFESRRRARPVLLRCS